VVIVQGQGNGVPPLRERSCGPLCRRPPRHGGGRKLKRRLLACRRSAHRAIPARRRRRRFRNSPVDLSISLFTPTVIAKAIFAPNAALERGLSADEKAVGDTYWRDVVIDGHLRSPRLSASEGALRFHRRQPGPPQGLCRGFSPNGHRRPAALSWTDCCKGRD
jgi:hypothetical protein